VTVFHFPLGFSLKHRHGRRVSCARDQRWNEKAGMPVSENERTVVSSAKGNSESWSVSRRARGNAAELLASTCVGDTKGKLKRRERQHAPAAM